MAFVCGNPFIDPVTRRNMGLVSKEGFREIAGCGIEKLLKAEAMGILPEPKLVSKSGSKKLWDREDAEAFIMSGALKGRLENRQMITSWTRGRHLVKALEFHRGQTRARHGHENGERI